MSEDDVNLFFNFISLCFRAFWENTNRFRSMRVVFCIFSCSLLRIGGISNYITGGKSRLKYETWSYLKMVVHPLKQMKEDNQKLKYWETKVGKEKLAAKALKENYGQVSEKLCKAMVENRFVRQRTKKHYEDNKKEMDYQGKFFKDQIDSIHQTLEEEERVFEEILPKERTMVKEAKADSKSNEGMQSPIVRQQTKKHYEENKEEMDYQEKFFKDQIDSIHQTLEEKRVFEEILPKERTTVKEANADSKSNEGMQSGEEKAKFVQDKGIEVFEADREILIKLYEEKKAEMRQMEETVELEEDFKALLIAVMAQYVPELLPEDGGSSVRGKAFNLYISLSLPLG